MKVQTRSKSPILAPNLNQIFMHKILHFILFSILLYFLPVALIFSGVILFEYRFHILVFAFLFAFVYSWFRNYSFADLGFKSNSFLSSLRMNLIISTILLFTLFILHITGIFTTFYLPQWSFFYIFYLFFSAPVQTFLYRSLIFLEMEKAQITNK